MLDHLYHFFRAPNIAYLPHCRFLSAPREPPYELRTTILTPAFRAAGFNNTKHAKS